MNKGSLESSPVVSRDASRGPSQQKDTKLSPIENKIKVRLKSMQSPTIRNTLSSDYTITTVTPAGSLNGWSPSKSTIAYIKKKSLSNVPKVDLPLLENNPHNAISNGSPVLSQATANKDTIKTLSSASITRINPLKIPDGAKKTVDHISARVALINNKEEGSPEYTSAPQTQRTLLATFFAPKLDKQKTIQEWKISNEIEENKPKEKKGSCGNATALKNSSTKTQPSKGPVHPPTSSNKLDEANEEKSKCATTGVNSQPMKKPRTSNILSKELAEKWGIIQSSLEKLDQSQIDENSESKEGSFSREGDQDPLTRKITKAKTSVFDLTLDKEKALLKKLRTINLNHPEFAISNRGGNLGLTSTKGRLDLHGFRRPNALPHRTDVFSSGNVDFFQFNEHNRFFHEFEGVNTTKTDVTDVHPVRKLENPDTPMLVAFSHTNQIVQPAFMKKVGSMCFTEFWSKKTREVFVKKKRDSAEYVRVTQPGRENETVYRPGKWKQEAFAKEKISDQTSAWTTKSVAIMKLIDRHDSPSPTLSKGSPTLRKHNQSNERGWGEPDLSSPLSHKSGSRRRLSKNYEEYSPRKAPVSTLEFLGGEKDDTKKYQTEGRKTPIETFEQVYLRSVNAGRSTSRPTNHTPRELLTKLSTKVQRSKSNEKFTYTTR